MNSYDYTLIQIDNFSFKCDISYPDSKVADIFEEWLLENFSEDDDFSIESGSYGTHAYTIYVIFQNESTAAAFKLRWC